MGSACCVPARDNTPPNGWRGENLHRNVQYSPTWSFQWDNPGRVAGEEISMGCFSDGVDRNGRLRIKYEPSYADDGSPVEYFQRCAWQKSPNSEGTAGQVRTPASDQSFSRNISMGLSLEQVKESPTGSFPSPFKPSLAMPSTSYLLSSPLSSHLPPASSTTSRWPRRSPGHLLSRQVSDSQILGFKSPDSYSVSKEGPDSYSVSEERPVLPSNESARGSRGGSSDGWSMHAFNGLMATSRRERWSFDSDFFGFNYEKLTRSSSRLSTSSSVDLQRCGVCSKLLTEQSSWSDKKIISNNELSVVAVLTCGHVYHAECLENMTPEISKYDPACPVCTFGEKQTLKFSEKALKAEMDLEARNKRSRNQVVDTYLDGNSFVLDRLKNSGCQGKGSKMFRSSSLKDSLGKPFLRQHFSFGSKDSKALSENHSTRKKGFFRVKSSKE
ncbi:hypothetical protein F2P56_036432 [Juglans regia]|uniref:Uncharacterized protein LOC109013339 n=2 Tax=Juglans regia TaxID=51240 RepID=A0A6P9E4J2_JUGRE|nr:uncharacterized protein LOC109013339 [Juglans regia]XP_035542419.1 uncharacterized protein LOC109013339 [Juglans regia]KAF5443916.1 hypothetical protein F2P56_036432 [Juglans regia]